ncbi:MAG: hypothetical protein IPM57_05135 [Oligoflexia bacterium]|nr:hypothetical protein [Oligoflexia bacterium]
MRLLLCFSLLLCASTASAKVLFEGWFEVFSGAKKIGYSVQRYEFDNNKFKATTYLKTNADGNSITESIKAFSGADLKPLSYSYTSKVGKEIKIIDATFSKDKMNLKIHDGAKETKKTVVLKKPGTFLSTFTPYVLMAQKKDDKGEGGLQVSKKNIIYAAVAEEDGAVYNGVLRVTSLDNVKEKKAYKILNKFKDQEFASWITPEGEFLLTRAPKLNIEVRISENMKDATGDLGVNLNDLKLLFGKLPGETVATDKRFEKHDTTKAGITTQPGVEIKGVKPSANSDDSQKAEEKK